MDINILEFNGTFGRMGIERQLGFIHCKGGSAPAPPPPPDPPATERRTEVVTAERMTRMDARKRKGQLATLFAGQNQQTQQDKQYGPTSLLGG